MNNKVGIYVRVSSEKQVLEGYSIEWQEELLINLVKVNNYEVTDIYREKGISGSKVDNRPELLRMLEDIKSGKINHVFVYKIDRLGRNVKENCEICEILLDNNSGLTTSDMGYIELDKAYGKLLFTLFTSLSQYEVNNLSERVKSGKLNRVKRGLYNNSNSVYGYDRYYDNVTGESLLKVNDFESIIVNNIFDMYINGMSINQIANKLSVDKIPTKRGGKWKQSTISSILSNKLYIGLVVYCPNSEIEFESAGKHKAILEEKKFIRVRQMILEKKETKAKKMLSRFSYFATKLHSRKNVNSIFKPKQTKTNDRNSVRYYSNNKEIPSINHCELENKFTESLKDYYVNYNDYDFNKLFLDSSYFVLENTIKKYNDDKDNLTDLFLERIISKKNLLEKMEILENKIKLIQEKLDNYNSKLDKFDLSMESKLEELFSLSLNDIFKLLSSDDKKLFVNNFIESVDIDCEHNIHIKWIRQCSY